MFVTSRTCQDATKNPRATDKSLLALQQRYARWLPREQPLERPKADRIRVGYHCSFMDSDTIRFQMNGVFRAHDRNRFEVIGYAPRFPNDQRGCFEFQRHTGNLGTRAFADRVRKDGVDIFVELSGFSPGHRFAAMARRCAPVQISYLNHAGTSGIPAVDYIVTDRAALPDATHYTEEPIYLPGCFFRFDYRGMLCPPIAEPPCLKNGYITFGCFGSITKLNRELIKLWARVLRAVPGSKMRLQNAGLRSAWHRWRITRWFKQEGIHANRLILKGPVSRFDLMKAYAKVDISLDTWPYCGGNTIAESFWQGVPVVTLKGNRFSSSYGASLVSAAGYPQLVARFWFEEIATQITPQWLAHERPHMRSKGFQLWDSKTLAQNLDEAYEKLCVA